MLLTPANSLCDIRQKEIVSRDKGSQVRHIAVNTNQQYDVRQYQLDGVLIRNQTCNDFLVLNDSLKKAYYIELKGRDVKKAVDQLIAGERICRTELKGYVPYYRIVASKSLTHNNWPKNYRDLLVDVGKERFLCKTKLFREDLG